MAAWSQVVVVIIHLIHGVFILFWEYFRMIDHIQKHETSDPFLAGISQTENPFKDQKGCLIL